MRYLRAKKVHFLNRWVVIAAGQKGRVMPKTKGGMNPLTFHSRCAIVYRAVVNHGPYCTGWPVVKLEALGVLDELERLPAAMTPLTSTVNKWCAQSDSRAATIASDCCVAYYCRTGARGITVVAKQ